MKKILMILVALIGFGTGAGAQSWQGVVIHNGYKCYSLGSLVNHTVLAAKGQNVVGSEWILVKIKSPYRWSSTNTANVTIGDTDTQLHYNNGWVYLSLLVCGNKVCNSNSYDSITLYQDNNWKGSSRKITLSLKTLRVDNMPFNSGEFETYW
jgi:hypothetical protein